MKSLGLLYSGENRKAARARLVDQYTRVASRVPARWSGDGPHGRVVLIHAERGLGKTRLALELYRHLASETHDPSGYWPRDHDDAGTDVALMSPATGCDFDARFPFL